MEELNYDIKSKIVVADGNVYRSRLEARWARFLGDLVYHCEHEPKYAYDYFSGWLPDFAMLPSSRDTQCVYCEVKPLYLRQLPLIVSNKIEKAERNRQGDADNDIPIVILGAKVPVLCNGIFSLGWVSYRRRGGKREWKPLPIVPFIQLVAPHLMDCGSHLIAAIELRWESASTQVDGRMSSALEAFFSYLAGHEDLREKERKRRIARARYFELPGVNDWEIETLLRETES